MKKISWYRRIVLWDMTNGAPWLRRAAITGMLASIGFAVVCIWLLTPVGIVERRMALQGAMVAICLYGAIMALLGAIRYHNSLCLAVRARPNLFGPPVGVIEYQRDAELGLNCAITADDFALEPGMVYYLYDNNRSLTFHEALQQPTGFTTPR